MGIVERGIGYVLVVAHQPWNYDEVPPPPIERGPTWECPGGLCHCHPRTDEEERQFSIMLFERDCARMPGARCRVWINGRIVNGDQPYADEQGWVTVVVPYDVTEAFVEWAPPDMPLRSPYPYRKRIHVAIDERNPDEAAARRLSNIGYDNHLGLSENMEEFRADFGYQSAGAVDSGAAFADSPSDRIGEVRARSDLSELNEKARLEGAGDGEPGPRPPAPKRRAPNPTGGSQATPGQVSARAAPRVVIHAFSFFALSFPKVMTEPRKGGGTRPKRQRWGAGDSQPVGSAEVRFFDSTDALVAAVKANNSTTQTNRFGTLTLDLSALADGDYTMTLTPPASHQLRPRVDDDVPCRGKERQAILLSPASPNDNLGADAVGHKRFRPVEVLVQLRGGAFGRVRIANDIAGGVTGSGGGFVRVFRENAGTLWVDWRPDRVQLKSPGSKVRRDRPGTETPLRQVHFIHLHHTEAPTPGSSIDTFVGSSAQGAHYLVDVDGFFLKLAHESQIARHTGRAAWFDLDSSPGGTIGAFNDISVGIEHVHLLGRSFPDDQAFATLFLLAGIKTVFGVPNHNVLGDGETALQSDAPKRLGRKVNCPGKDFPWDRLEGHVALAPSLGPVAMRRTYNGHFSGPPPHPPISSGTTDTLTILDLQDALAEIGYFVTATGTYDEPTLRAVEAFRNRYLSGPRRRTRLNKAKDASGEAAANFDLVELIERVVVARGGAAY